MKSKIKTLKEVYININNVNGFNVNIVEDSISISKNVSIFMFDSEYYISENIYNYYSKSIRDISLVNVIVDNKVHKFYKVIKLCCEKPIRREKLIYYDLNKKFKTEERVIRSKYLANSIFDTNSKYFVEEIDGKYIFYINTETQIESYYGFGLIIHDFESTIKQNKKFFQLKETIQDLLSNIIFESNYHAILISYNFLFLTFLAVIILYSLFSSNVNFNYLIDHYAKYYNLIFYVINSLFIIFFIFYYFKSTFFTLKKNTLYKESSNLVPIITNNHIIYSNGIFYNLFFRRCISFYTVRFFSKYKYEDNLISRQNIIVECSKSKGWE